jgi:uncharacterized FlaG/YvyC family protein
MNEAQEMPEERIEETLAVEGSEQVVADESTEETTEETTESSPEKSEGLKSAIERGMESLSKALNSALENRGNVVMVRVNDEALQHLDMLVEAEVTSSRSESAAFLINEGIRVNAALFDQIRDITEQIAALREQLRESVNLGKTEEDTSA